ncbi:MAG TPA: hypothetical protein PK816_17365, partial [Candidatus Cloacimonadota bacterium]|nr:hypothetical protein [Candidatus Cloacimonadota bacterium]
MIYSCTFVKYKKNEVYKTLEIMAYRSKIRMSIGWIYPIGIFSSYILLLLEFQVRQVLSQGGCEISGVPYLTIAAVSLMFILLGIIQWFRYRNWIYPVLGFLIGITTVQVSFVFPDFDSPGIFKLTYFTCFILIILFILINWNSFYSHERFEINSRRLFRLAAEKIYKTDDGYTERPYSGGRVDCTKDELLGFVRFLHGNYIIRPFYYESNVCLSFSMNTSLVVIHEGKEVSHIIIGYDGIVTVKVSDKDYRDYRERLSFDQLCTSLADIFIRFYKYYKEGLESRIMIELKS